LAVKLLGLTGIERTAVLIGASLPPSILTFIFVEENELDTDYTSNMLSLSLLFELIFIVFLLNFI